MIISYGPNRNKFSTIESVNESTGEIYVDIPISDTPLDYEHVMLICGASGDYSHTEGRGAIATGEASHAEGVNTIASGNFSHAEGTVTSAKSEN
jgi:hypothetical protein